MGQQLSKQQNAFPDQDLTSRYLILNYIYIIVIWFQTICRRNYHNKLTFYLLIDDFFIYSRLCKHKIICNSPTNILHSNRSEKKKGNTIIHFGTTTTHSTQITRINHKHTENLQKNDWQRTCHSCGVAGV